MQQMETERMNYMDNWSQDIEVFSPSDELLFWRMGGICSPFLNHFIDIIQCYIWKLEFSFENWWWDHYAVKFSCHSPLHYIYEFSILHWKLIHPPFKAI